MRYNLGVLVAVFGASFGMACSSGDNGAVGDSDTRDGLTVEATTATREAIGVTSWGISPGTASAVVHGYDDQRAQLVSFEYHVARADAATFEAALDTRDGHATLRVEAPDATHLRVLEDSFAGSAAAKVVLARIVSDLRSQPARPSATTGPGLAKTSLTMLADPQSLVEPGQTTLVEKCAALSVSAAADGAETAGNCAGGSNATGCNQGIDGTTTSQGNSDECKLDCSGDATAISPSEVEISTVSSTSGEEATRGYIDSALNALCIQDTAARDRWTRGYLTLTSRESSFNPNAVNTYDTNATGPTAADGNPQNCSRGLAQCIPTTFAANHQPGTSNNIYDPVANIAASMNYAMSEYGVSRDGSDLAAKIQQADPSRGPGGY